MPQVGILMGSDSDLATMSKAAKILEQFGVEFEMHVISAHRMPDVFYDYAQTAEERGLKVIIAGAGGAAHLPGMCAAMFPLPVIGVPISTKSVGGVDSLYSIVQMPSGIPVATVAIDGAANAALLAIRMLAISDESLLEKLKAYAKTMKQGVQEKSETLQRIGYEEYLKRMQKK
ncbi:MAG: 5-(carboxyamino)imidazole ribonucleotide mutase [Lachnospiraceae bacterium]|nr:5-(carboxyamino)imidazole ribonucleotide mutase [Lachnospiraceae bacterium]